MIIEWIKIKRYLSKQSDESERDDVEMWMKRSEDNQVFLDNANEFYGEDFKFFEDEQREVNFAWQKVNNRINSPKKRNQRRIAFAFAFGTIAAAMVAMYFGVYNPVEQNINTKPIISQLNIDTTNINNATLILADGRVIDLEKEIENQDIESFEISNNTVKTVTEVKTNSDSLKKNIVRHNQISIPKGTTYQLFLADSTKVILNSGSVMVFPTYFDGADRRVKLIGEAYFEVTKNPNKPFIVEIEGGNQIEVLGTQFNVKARLNSNSETTLITGSVMLHTNNQRVKLVPGEQCIIDNKTKYYNITNPDLSALLAWMRCEFIFKDAILGDIVKELNDWYDVNIEIANEFVKRKKFHIYMKRGNNIEDVLEKLAQTEQISYSKEGKNIKIDNFRR